MCHAAGRWLLCILGVTVVSWYGSAVAADGSGLTKAVESFLKPKCGKAGIKFEPARKAMERGAWRCDCAPASADCPSMTVQAIAGTFTSRPWEEAFLAVDAPDEVPHAGGSGYTVLVRLIVGSMEEMFKTEWKTIAKGDALPSVTSLAAIATDDRTSLILACSEDCWQSCCTGSCSVSRLAVDEKRILLANAGVSIPTGDTGELGETYRTASVKKVHMADVNKDGHEDLVVILHTEEGKQDESFERKPSRSKDTELHFLFDGKTFKKAPGSPDFGKFGC